MRSSILFTLASAVAVSAQSNFTSCCSLEPNSVDINLRNSWCRAQTNTCPDLCDNGQTSNNTCDAATLTYSCVCLTGNTPNISAYQQTLPSLECGEWYKQCIDASPNNLAGQQFCASYSCGNETASVTPSTTTSASSSSGPSGTTTSSPTSTPNSAHAMIHLGKSYGTGAILVGIFAIFGFAL